jgi:broad specificity phosphatase PhoE
MPQTIYLSRHGETRQNQLVEQEIRWWEDEKYYKDPSIWNLTERGEKVEPVILGRYLKIAIWSEGRSEKDFIIITSSNKRSITTGIVVARTTGIASDSIHWSNLLDEAIQRELLPADPAKRSQFVQEAYERSETAEEIGNRAYSEIERIANSHPEKHIIATLHGGVNRNFLKRIGYEIKEFGNCGLVKLHYSDRRFSVRESYKSLEQMAAELGIAYGKHT